MLVSVTQATEDQKVSAMDQAVNHGSGHLLIIEDVYPFAKLKVCGYDHTPLLIAV